MKNWIGSKIEKCKQNIVIESIILNLAYLFVMQLCLTPFLSIDDFYMSNIVYGVYGESYDYQVTYMNFLYGRLIVFLLRLFPRIPWYTVLFDIWIFIALTLLTYVILKWSNNYAGFLLANILLLFFSYEGYVAIQFTKVAGILGAVALLILVSNKTSRKLKFVGLALFLLSCMVRRECAKMVIGVWCLILGGRLLADFWNNRKLLLKAHVQKVFFFMLGVCIFFVIPNVSSLGMSMAERDFWRMYWEHNAIRSGIQDYVIPDYEENQNTYNALGISENDLSIFRGWNWDCNVMTLEKGEVLQAMREGDKEKEERLLSLYLLGKEEPETEEAISFMQKLVQSMSAAGELLTSFLKKVLDIEMIADFFKIFPKAFLKIDVCTAYFMTFFTVLVCWRIRGRELLLMATLSGGVLLFLNYYLYTNQRYLQHRVDVGIVLTAIVVFLAVLTEHEYSLSGKKENRLLVSGILPLLLLSGTYFFYGDDVQVPNEQIIWKNKSFYKETMADTEHDYLLGQNRGNGGELSIFYGVYDVPEIGAMKNILRGTQRHLKEGWAYTDAIDNDDIYFVLGDNDRNELSWEIYFTEHGEASAKLVLVKQYLGKKLYCVRTKSPKEVVDLRKMTEASDLIVEEIESTVSQNTMTISGSAYLAGNTGFSQKVYVQVENMRTGEYELYDTSAVCDETKKYGDDGYFAEISTTIELPDFYNRSSRVNLIIEQDGKFYCKKIRQKHLKE